MCVQTLLGIGGGFGDVQSNVPEALRVIRDSRAAVAVLAALFVEEEIGYMGGEDGGRRGRAGG